MAQLLRLLCGALIGLFQSSAGREAEILVLRQQINVLGASRQRDRPSITPIVCCSSGCLGWFRRRLRHWSRLSVARWRCRFWADCTTKISGRKFPTGTGLAEANANDLRQYRSA